MTGRDHAVDVLGGDAREVADPRRELTEPSDADWLSGHHLIALRIAVALATELRAQSRAATVAARARAAIHLPRIERR